MSISCDFLGKIRASSANFVHRPLWQLVVIADTWVALGCISQNRGGFFWIGMYGVKKYFGRYFVKETKLSRHHVYKVYGNSRFSFL